MDLLLLSLSLKSCTVVSHSISFIYRYFDSRVTWVDLLLLSFSLKSCTVVSHSISFFL